eukprot:CFRG5177T1
MGSLVIPENFHHILRLLNTNVDGRTKIVFALTSIRGLGRRYATLVCKKADVPLRKRAGELNDAEIERIVTIMQNPRQYKIPDYFLNRQKDIKDEVFVTGGASVSVVSTPRLLVAADALLVSLARNKFFCWYIDWFRAI